MSFNRKLKRNQTTHSHIKCKCGNETKFCKNISFRQNGKIEGTTKVVTYHNVYWCRKCGNIYEYDKIVEAVKKQQEQIKKHYEELNNNLKNNDVKEYGEQVETGELKND